jgi:hypothetical protein
MFYIYLFIFLKNKIVDIHYHSYNLHNINNVNVDGDNYILSKVLLNNNFMKNNYLELNTTTSYVFKDGFDSRFNTSEEVNDLFYLFIFNQKKLNILNSLLSNSTSIPRKLELVNGLHDFQEKNKYQPSLFSGGFFKDSDFLF